MSRDGNILGCAHLQNRNYFVTENLNLWLKIKKNGQIYPNKSHSYHDEIGLDQGIIKRNT